MIVRSAPRFTLNLLVAFSGDQDGVGIIRNLSINGCCISSGTVVQLKQSLTLKFHPGDQGPLIVVDLADVRWAGAWDFGVAFQSMNNAVFCNLSRRSLPPNSRDCPHDRPHRHSRSVSHYMNESQARRT